MSNNVGRVMHRLKARPAGVWVKNHSLLVAVFDSVMTAARRIAVLHTVVLHIVVLIE